MVSNGTKADIQWIKETLKEIHDSIKQVRQDNSNITARISVLENINLNKKETLLTNFRFFDLVITVGMFVIAYLTYYN